MFTNKPKPGRDWDRLTLGAFYFVLFGAFASVYGWLVFKSSGLYIDSEWIAPSYVRTTTSTPMVTEDATKRSYSALPLWVPLTFGLGVAAVTYLCAALGVWFVSSEKIPRKGCDDKTKLATAAQTETSTQDEPTTKVAKAPVILSRNNYFAYVLFYARMFTIPVMTGFLTVSLVEKSVAALVLSMTAALSLNMIRTISSGMYLWIFGDWCKQQSHVTVGLGFDVGVLLLAIAWCIMFYFLAFPMCMSYSNAAAVPEPVRLCLIFYLVQLSFMSIYQLYDIVSFLSARIWAFKQESYSSGYAFWHGLDHVVHAAFTCVFFCYAVLELTEGGCSAP